MKLEKLFGSKTKVDIIKYLIFKRQGVSMRALESEIPRTFPAIKKQVDSLYEADVIDIEKDSTRRAITIKKDFYDNIKNIFLYTLQKEIIEI
jgi:predicted transcriptional regulator